MSLLRDIQHAAIDSSIPLSDLLRKCTLLAARLRNEELRAWVSSELNGYESKEGLPPYRIMATTSKGHFSGPFQSGLKNAVIPLSCLPQQFYEALSRTYVQQGIAALENLVNNASGTILKEPWNPDVAAHYGGNIYDGMNCVEAWKVIPVAAIVGVLDSVRTKVLNFAIDIESAAPEAGEAPPLSEPLAQDRVHQIFHTNIYGDVQNLANGSAGARQKATSIQNEPTLFKDLLKAIATSRADQVTIDSLVATVEEMRSAESKNSFHEAYIKFVSTVSDHMQILGTAVAPYLPQLAALAG
ncbi:hypothetical protein ABB26_12495 [Stenotrophomonas humi]|uniref:AbiTii domain-containing protein n=1 Tax=Stenotrophomonas humi TaxID=405444 RepID=A0A0R0C1W2_9GAMM|nr:hypothetical protein [Stenotrophomonas humi]KRG63371.1 hypothetical protein ABB26_12495 [Stenotrophomonas humi]